jgi:hypothetical protein
MEKVSQPVLMAQDDQEAVKFQRVLLYQQIDPGLH